MLPCSPSAAVFIHFGPEDGLGDSLTPGDYPIVAFGFDVSAREQGGDNEAMEFDGVVTITAAGNGRASGFMLGWARTELKSHLTQERLGATIEVGALAFHDIRAEWVSGDEE
jgi:hypothetical protein